MIQENFDFTKADQLYELEPIKLIGKKAVREVSQALKDYLDQYFFTIKGSYMFWDAEDQTFEQLTKEELKSMYMDKMISEDIAYWFFRQNRKLYKTVNKVNQPRIYENKLNLFYGYRYKTVKKYDEYSEEIRAKVEMFLLYMKEVLASDIESVFEYLKKWTAAMCQGKKNDSALYFKGIEGIGKSFFGEFMTHWVLGKRICVKGDIECVTTSFNKMLCGKLFALFEELPTFTTAQWEGVSSRFKDLITGTTANYSDKHEKRFEADNITNIIINTNVDALKGSDGRRYLIMPLSSKRLQDHAYFGELATACQNAEVGEAFFAYMQSIDTSNFHAQRDMPETEGKLNAIAERLPPEYRFLKDEYILNLEFGKKDIKMKVTDLHREYKIYCELNKKAPSTSVKFAAKLKEINLNYKTLNGYSMYNVTYDQLKTLATKLKWLHELDDWRMPPDQELDANIQPEGEINEKDEVIKDLRSQIENLKQQLEKYKLQPKTDPKTEPIAKTVQVKKAVVKKQKKVNNIMSAFDEFAD